jgi:hypothetical protein
MITNDVLYVAGVGGTSTPVECPIVEDSSFTKGGTSIGVTVDQPPGCWGSNFVHCKVFDSAVGSSCSAEQGISGNGTVTGTRSSSLGVKWSDGADYGYLYVGIGKRSNATASPCALKGYYMLK